MKRIPDLHITLILLILIFSSCSSKPKETGDVVDLRIRAEKELALGSREAARGKYVNALVVLTECRKNAVLTDNAALITRVCLIRGDVLFSLGRTEEAFEEWNYAYYNAELSADRELISISRIFRARGGLLSGRTPAQTALDEANRESANIKKDRLYTAFSWQVKGLALRALNSWNEAEDAFKKSLDIHEKDMYLENASYDWYSIASVRSLSGNTSGALQALEKAIDLDRRAENSWGLAASWRAMGDVYRKSGRTQEAVQAYSRAREIYLAMGNESEANEIEKRMNNE